MRILERVLTVATVAGVAAWVAAGLLVGSDAGVTVFVRLGLFYGGVGVLALWVVDLLVHVFTTGRHRERRSIRRRAATVLVFAAVVGVVVTGGAFRVRFLLSRPALDAFVARHASRPDAQVQPRTRIGLFWVREAEVLPGGVVRLITTPCMFDDCGVAYSPAGDPPRIGEDVYSRLGGNWYHWFRSW